MTITVAFIGQSVGNVMFTGSSAPPACPANCYMLNRSSLTWGPVTGNGAIAYATKLAHESGQEVRLYNACWDGSAMTAGYAPSGTPNFYWGQTLATLTGDGPLYSFFTQVTAGGYVPNLLELNQGQAEFAMTDPGLWVGFAAAMYTAILSHFGKTAAALPINVWTGLRGAGWPTSRNVLNAHQIFSSTVTGANLGVSYYDAACPDGIHPDATSCQIMGLRGAVVALKSLGVSPAGDCGPRITSADRFAHIITLTTSGHPLQVQPWRNLQGFQIWDAAFAGQITVADARVIDACTIRLVMPSVNLRPWVMYQADCGQPGGSPVYDTQDCSIPGFGMPLVPCLAIQSVT